MDCVKTPGTVATIAMETIFADDECVLWRLDNTAFTSSVE